MKPSRIYCSLTFLFSFCGFVYLLIMPQASILLGGAPVFSYVIIFALFIFAFEAGRVFPARHDDPARALVLILGIEGVLALGGGFVGLGVSFVVTSGWPLVPVLFLTGALSFILAFCKGAEVALIGGDLHQDEGSHNRLLLLFYAGVLAASASVVLFLLPLAGLATTAFLTGFVNAVAAMFLFTQRTRISPPRQKLFYLFLHGHLALAMILAGCFLYTLGILKM